MGNHGRLDIPFPDFIIIFLHAKILCDLCVLGGEGLCLFCQPKFPEVSARSAVKGFYDLRHGY
jgi:hypothetical protein